VQFLAMPSEFVFNVFGDAEPLSPKSKILSGHKPSVDCPLLLLAAVQNERQQGDGVITLALGSPEASSNTCVGDPVGETEHKIPVW